MNWQLTLTKSVVIGALATLAAWGADVQSSHVWWAGLAVLAIESARDYIKSRFGSFVATPKAE